MHNKILMRINDYMLDCIEKEGKKMFSVKTKKTVQQLSHCIYMYILAQQTLCLTYHNIHINCLIKPS